MELGPLLLSLLLLLATAHVQPGKAWDLVAQDITAGFTRFGGSAPGDYAWSSVRETVLLGDAADVLPNKPWTRLSIEAVPGAIPGPKSYAALWQELAAEPYWGQRVRFRALVGRRFIPVSGVDGSYAALFVRVQTADRATLAMDEMSRRPIASMELRFGFYEIVIDVPGPPPGTCPNDDPIVGNLPAFIQIGVLLCGGRGVVLFGQATFQVVSRTEAPVVTGGNSWYQHPGSDVL